LAFICEPGTTRPDIRPAPASLTATPAPCTGDISTPRGPTLRVKSGDLIQAEAITHHAGDAPSCVRRRRRAIFTEVPEAIATRVHIMTAIFVEDAKPATCSRCAT